MDQVIERSLEETPVWAVSVVCFVLIFLSIFIEAGLNLLTKYLKRRKRNSLKQALGKIKTELMIMGFISLLLTIGEDLLVKICVSQAAGDSFLPCEEPPRPKYPFVSATDQVTRTNASVIPVEYEDKSYCEEKGMISLISSKGIKQLHIFIFVLTVFHVLYCVLTMCLGLAKMRRWKYWEEETQTLQYEIENDPRRFRLTRQTSFGQRHLKFWSDQPILLWPVCFLRLFCGSVTKVDYFALRNGFMVAHFAEGSNFNFQKFLVRAFDDDFVQVVGISFWIWIFSILFIFFSAHGFYNYFWLPFIPLLMVLAVGMKLQVIITKMCLESDKTAVVHGTMLVKPTDNLFWFGRPQLLLHLIHFILFQNSFQLAFFTWTWYEYGIRSCFHRTTVDISLRIAMGVIVQFHCGYVTLPLYALVTQMGSGMSGSVFTERVAKGLKQWHRLSRQNLSRSGSALTRHSEKTLTEHVTKGLKHWNRLAHQSLSRNRSTSTERSTEPWIGHTREGSFSGAEDLISAGDSQHPSFPVTNSPRSEIMDAVPHGTFIRGTYNGEISVEESGENDKVPSLSVTNSAATAITEVIQHKNTGKGSYDGEISFRTMSEPRHLSGTFLEHVGESLKHWHTVTQPNLFRNRSTLTEHSPEPWISQTTDGSFSGSEESTSAGNSQYLSFPVSNSTTSEITEAVLHETIVEGTCNNEISNEKSRHNDKLPSFPMGDSATTEITEVVEHKIISEGSYDGEISFQTTSELERPPLFSITNSATTDITEEAAHNNNNITRETQDSEVIFDTLGKHEYLLPITTKAEITEGFVQQKNITRGVYDGEISFGTSWKELGSSN